MRGQDYDDPQLTQGKDKTHALYVEGALKTAAREARAAGTILEAVYKRLWSLHACSSETMGLSRVVGLRLEELVKSIELDVVHASNR